MAKGKEAAQEAGKDQTLASFSDEKQEASRATGQEEKQAAKQKEAAPSMPIAHELAKKQRDIGVGEFFARNKHLLGFDNPRKALLTVVKEAVDNALDACEEAVILPDISVQLIDMGNERFRVIVEDNGPGIVKQQVPKIFAKLLYGSKFHSRKQQRGQQGIGISAAVMYGQLTTGRPAKIRSKIGKDHLAYVCELHINTQQNKPEIVQEEEKEWSKEHGTRIEIDLEGSYQKGQQSVDEYLKHTAVVNPHVMIVYVSPKAEQLIFPRVTEQFPKQAMEIKPHPHGTELGTLMAMLHDTQFTTLQQFLQNEFSRISPAVAKEVCENARILPKTKPQDVSREDAERIAKAFQETKIMAPPTDCLSPITQELLEKGLKKEVNAEFYAAVTRDPVVYKGNPFQVEVALAYGGDQPKDKQAKLMRFANRVPLLYQQGACATSKAVAGTNWKAYGLQQSGSNLPVGPLTIVVHLASVWVPFTSESKEAIADYEDIGKEIKLALQEAGRQLQRYVHKKTKVHLQLERANIFERYIPEVANALKRLTGEDEDALVEGLKAMVKKEKIQETIDTMQAVNAEYDEDWARIGKDDSEGPEEGDGSGKEENGTADGEGDGNGLGSAPKKAAKGKKRD